MSDDTLNSEYDEYDDSSDDSYDDSSDDSYYDSYDDSSDDSYDDSSDDSYGDSSDDDSYESGYSYDQDYEDEGGYTLTFDTEGNFLALYEIEDDGSLENETDLDSEYLFVDGLLYETEREDHGVEIKVYSDVDGDGVYQKISSQYTPNADAPSGHFALTEALRVSGTDDDDYVLLSDLEDAYGGGGSDSFVMRDLSECTIRDFDADEGDKLVFDTGFGLTNVDELSQYVSFMSYDASTETLTVDFTGYASLEIVGISELQISWNIVEILS